MNALWIFGEIVDSLAAILFLVLGLSGSLYAYGFVGPGPFRRFRWPEARQSRGVSTADIAGTGAGPELTDRGDRRLPLAEAALIEISRATSTGRGQSGGRWCQVRCTQMAQTSIATNVEKGNDQSVSSCRRLRDSVFVIW